MGKGSTVMRSGHKWPTRSSTPGRLERKHLRLDRDFQHGKPRPNLMRGIRLIRAESLVKMLYA
jgi:hypothetical protein